MNKAEFSSWGHCHTVTAWYQTACYLIAVDWLALFCAKVMNFLKNVGEMQCQP